MKSDSIPTILEATLGDLDQLVALEKAFPEPDRISRRSWRRFLKMPGTVLVVRDETGPSAAAVLLFRQNSTKARLYSIAVGAGGRGRGYGWAILEACLRLAEDRGCQMLTLEVRLSNEAAIGLYRKFGFEVSGTLVGYYDDGEAALHMTKTLSKRQTNT